MTKPTVATKAADHHQVKIVRISDRQKELDRLPRSDTKRWVTRRKAQVVAAVRDGLLTFEEARTRYSLSEEELKSWAKLLDNHGLEGLRATRIQEYRGAQQDRQHESGAAAE
jgi:hypothetical protein